MVRLLMMRLSFTKVVAVFILNMPVLDVMLLTLPEFPVLPSMKLN